MAKKVAKLGIERDNHFMYYIKNGDVWRVPRKQAGKPKGRPAKVAAGGVEMDTAYIYYLDRDGDIARAKRLVGGKKRKAKKAAPARKVGKKKATTATARKARPKKTAARRR
jgi:hypothetical protein